MGKYFTKVLKSGKFQVYDSKTKKVVTPEGRKDYFRLNIDAGLPMDKLSKEDKRFINGYKGGKKRAANSLTDQSGKFLSKRMEMRVNKMMGGDLQKVFDKLGAKDLKEAIKKAPKFREKFFKLLEKTQDEFSFNSNQYQAEIGDFPGKIFVNGKEVTKIELFKMVADLQAAAAQTYSSGFDFSIRLKYKGIKRADITLPTVEEVEQMSSDELYEVYGDDFRVYGS